MKTPTSGSPKKPIDRIRTARTVLLMDHPFFGALICKLTPIAAHFISTAGPDGRITTEFIRTMGTDGKVLVYNPDFVDNLLDEYLTGVLAHEVMHPALCHHTRRGDRDPKLWNKACDYAINPIVLDAGLKLPDWVLNESRFRNMPAEAIYNKLLDEQAQQQQQQQGQQVSGNGNSQCSSGGCGQSQQQQQPGQPQNGQSTSEKNPGQQPGQAAGKQSGQPEDGQDAGEDPQGQQQTPDASTQGRVFSPCSEFDGDVGQVFDAASEQDPSQPLSPAERGEIEREWRTAVEAAEACARMQGKVPLGVERAIGESVGAQVDWRDRFRKSFSSLILTDYSWMRPNRRQAHTGVYLPGIKRDGVGPIVVAVDCSGSISQRQLTQFSDEMNALIVENRPETVHVMYFEAVVTRHETYATGETVEFNANGGGGTCFEPVFQKIEEEGIEPEAVVFLTDMYGSFPRQEPVYPVIWVSVGGEHAPFGEVISIASA